MKLSVSRPEIVGSKQRLDSITKHWTRTSADEKAVATGCVFRAESAERVRTFFTKFLRHSKGGFAGQPFELLDWQWESIIAPLFGWRRSDGTRRYRRLSAWVSKKNGKSTIAAGLVLYGLMADNEPGAHVYSAAADRQQASIIYEECAQMVRQSPALAGKLKPLDTTKRIVYEAKGSFYEVLSKESRKTGHGLNAHMVVIDELHVVNRELYSTLRYAGAARRQPLQVEISTAGNDKNSLGFDRYNYAKSVQKGVTEDSDLLVYIAEADGNDRWEEPEQWQKANPSLGVTISRESFEADFRTAKNGTPADQADFKQLRLNLWQDSGSPWMPVAEWDACKADFDLRAELVTRQADGADCWGGLDLASSEDLAALVLTFAVAGDYWVRAWFWAPAEADTARAKRNKARLRPWMDAGYIKATEGNTIDFDTVEKDIVAIFEEHYFRELAFDPWNATGTATRLEKAGIKVIQFPQTTKNYNEPLRKFGDLIRERRIKHDGNPVLRWCFDNLWIRPDPAGNIRPDKEKSADKIDGITGLLMGLGRAIVKEQPWYEPGALLS